MNLYYIFLGGLESNVEHNAIIATATRDRTKRCQIAARRRVPSMARSPLALPVSIGTALASTSLAYEYANRNQLHPEAFPPASRMLSHDSRYAHSSTEHQLAVRFHSSKTSERLSHAVGITDRSLLNGWAYIISDKQSVSM
jgi:hypothetical protein